MIVTYIYHSCYLLETPQCNVIFDYYKDTGNKPGEGIINDRILSDDKPLYVFSSHSHPDHFNRDILNWKSHKKNITYVFSKDILDLGKTDSADALFLDKGDSYKDEFLVIKAYGSTDIGVSFYVEIDGKKIFHAGDLNNWHWKDESTKEEIMEAESFYERELNDVAQDIKTLYLAMFPIDPRLGTDFMKGAIQFISRISVKHIAPMHFGEAYDKIASFDEQAKAANSMFMQITQKGQQLTI